MTKEALTAICRENEDLYITPHLNDRLYAGHCGFSSIEFLEPYTGLKSLFLNGNALVNVIGLPNFAELTCLFLQQNGLESLQGLSEAAPQLKILDVSQNCLGSLDGIGSCTRLETLVAAHNKITSSADIRDVMSCTAIETLDLQYNQIGTSDFESILSSLAELQSLKCLYLKGNPAVPLVSNYRKIIISSLANLTYLDDCPVDEAERRCAVAWSKKGLQGERDEMAQIKKEKRVKEARHFENVKKMLLQAKLDIPGELQ